MAATGWLDGAVRACMAPLAQADERLVALGWAAHVTVDAATARGRLSHRRTREGRPRTAPSPSVAVT
jgi:hypothetical protein